MTVDVGDVGANFFVVVAAVWRADEDMFPGARVCVRARDEVRDLGRRECIQ